MAKPENKRSPSLSGEEILALLDTLIEEGEWGSEDMKDKVKANILAPLQQQIQKEKTSDAAAGSYIKALKSLARNPHDLREFGDCVVTGAYLNDTFAVLSLSDVTSTRAFKRLGFRINHRYSINDILGTVSSEDFRSRRACYVIGESHITTLNEELGKGMNRYFSLSEHVARKLINSHLDFLFDRDSDLISCAILEICLARLSSNLRPAEVRCGLGTHTNRTYLTGCTDFFVLKFIEVDAIPKPELFKNQRAGNASRIFDRLNLRGFNETYTQLMERLKYSLPPEYYWEALLIEAKSTEWFSSGNVKSCNLYQTIATCCLAGRYGRSEHQVLKFCLSSGLHWTFGVVNNEFATVYVSEMIDNSELTRTQDVISLLTNWVVLPGPTLEKLVFSKLTPVHIEERFLFPDESEDNPQTRAVFFDGVKFDKVEATRCGLARDVNIATGSDKSAGEEDSEVTVEKEKAESEVGDENDETESEVSDGEAAPDVDSEEEGVEAELLGDMAEDLQRNEEQS